MSGIRKNIWKYLKDRVFRQSYVEEHVRAGIAHQIKAMREARGWSQAQLAEKCGKSQSNIARIEDPDYGKFSIQTLLEIAHSFDVWLSLEFVSFSKGLARTADRSVKALNAVSFEDEQSQSAYFSQAFGKNSSVKKPSIFDTEFLPPQTSVFGSNMSAKVSDAAQTGKLSAGVKQVQNETASLCN
jgi:transcriptional regulator with XRE-family HTH domain